MVPLYKAMFKTALVGVKNSSGVFTGTMNYTTFPELGAWVEVEISTANDPLSSELIEGILIEYICQF